MLQVVFQQAHRDVVVLVCPNAAFAKQLAGLVDVEQQNASSVLFTVISAVTLFCRNWFCVADWDPVQQAAEPVVQVVLGQVRRCARQHVVCLNQMLAIWCVLAFEANVDLLLSDFFRVLVIVGPILTNIASCPHCAVPALEHMVGLVGLVSLVGLVGLVCSTTG